MWTTWSWLLSVINNVSIISLTLSLSLKTRSVYCLGHFVLFVWITEELNMPLPGKMKDPWRSFQIIFRDYRSCVFVCVLQWCSVEKENPVTIGFWLKGSSGSGYRHTITSHTTSGTPNQSLSSVHTVWSGKTHPIIIYPCTVYGKNVYATHSHLYAYKQKNMKNAHTNISKLLKIF